MDLRRFTLVRWDRLTLVTIYEMTFSDLFPWRRRLDSSEAWIKHDFSLTIGTSLVHETLSKLMLQTIQFETTFRNRKFLTRMARRINDENRNSDTSKQGNR